MKTIIINSWVKYGKNMKTIIEAVIADSSQQWKETFTVDAYLNNEEANKYVEYMIRTYNESRRKRELTRKLVAVISIKHGYTVKYN